MERIISIIIGYLFGCFQTAYIIGKFKSKIDIRQYGSGNSGTTNAIRVMGWKLGLLTFFGDFLKAVVGVLIVALLFNNPILGFYSGLGVVIGHNWPVFLKFKGGKGIAATAGLLVAVDYRVGLICIGIFLLIVFFTRYVSLGSMVMVACSPILLGIFHGFKSEHVLLACVLTVFAIYRHHSNIKRLIRGEENKLGHKKELLKKEQAEA